MIKLFNNILFISLCVFFLWIPTNAQHYSLSFERLTINEGLSNNSINNVLQTNDGYLWIATKDGLNRFDGNHFKIFNHNPTDSASLPENYVMSLFESRDGAFWIGTWGGGLCHFDPDYELFMRCDAPDKNDDYVQSIIEDHHGFIWYGTTTGGLNKLDPKTHQVTSFNTKSNRIKGFPADNITSIAEDKQYILWLGTIGKGLIKFNPGSGEFEQFIHDPNNINSIANNSIQFVYNDSNKVLYLSTESGIDCFDLNTRRITHHPGVPSNQKLLLTTPIRQIIRDRQSRIWAGSYEYHGLFQFINKKNGGTRFTHFEREDDNPNSLISNRIRCIYQDSRNNIWIGTEDGLNKLPAVKPFIQYRYLPVRKTSLGGRVVSSIVEGKNNVLWIGLGGGGFDRIDKTTNTITHFKHDPNNSNSLTEDDVVTIYEDRYGILWIGTRNGGLNRYDPQTGKYKHFIYDPNIPTSIRSNWVQHILETRDSLFLIGTNEALQVLDRKSESFEVYSPDVGPDSESFHTNIQTNALFEDKEGNLWIGTWLDGLMRYDPESKKVYHYLPDLKNPFSLSTNKITTIYQDSKGFIWIGTHSGGLNKFDKKTGEFSIYTTRNGLPNDVVFGVLEDSRNNLWISTMKGLVKFNPNTEKFRTYDETDGIIHNQFNWRACYKNCSGIMYFGGINGFISFHPDDIKLDTIPPPVVITSFKIFDKEAVLHQSLRSVSVITLPHNQNFLIIEFMALDIAPKNKHSYSYILKGIDPYWVDSSTKSTATYTDIRPGSYTFQVKACNVDRIWSKPISLSIIILPPWWMTWWSKLLIAAIVIILSYAIYKYRVHQLLEIHRIRLNISSDLHDEIGSNLSSINVESRMLLERAEMSESEREQLKDISNTAKETIDAIRDIIWFINPKNTSSEDVIFKMKETAARLLAGIHWTFNTSQGIRLDQLRLEVRRSVFLIYKEALTNVLRHSSATHCNIQINANSNNIELLIKDDGIGFKVNETNENTGLNSIRRRAEKINAVLEITSKEGKGAQINLQVPLKVKIKYQKKDLLKFTTFLPDKFKKYIKRIK
ncbi:hypothetical protein KJ762_03165 [bacterium]|nr:hypothetical protein [bacterium]MBU1064518.1 hypothetical protein [bacterium]MBU1633492.1 hypothetical protein [bacterium]MBU1874473.1 hypothetical protein [bacterium]